jgi:LPS export ABC transporter protein LptC
MLLIAAADTQSRLRLLLLLLLTAVTSLWYFQHHPATTVTKIRNYFEADGEMNQIILQEFNNNGFPQSSLTAERAIQFAQGNDNYMLFHKPSLRVLSSNQNNWHLSADRGELTNRQGLSQLNFSGGVAAVQINDQGHATEIHTERLILDPKNNALSTDSPITITQPQQRIQANGMTALLNSGEIQLHSDVHIDFTNRE